MCQMFMFWAMGLEIWITFRCCCGCADPAKAKSTTMFEILPTLTRGRLVLGTCGIFAFRSQFYYQLARNMEYVFFFLNLKPFISGLHRCCSTSGATTWQLTWAVIMMAHLLSGWFTMVSGRPHYGCRQEVCSINNFIVKIRNIISL